MTRARGASRPRFRLLPTVLLTLAILGVPTAVYAWGRNSAEFAITTVTVSGTDLVPEKRALRLLRREFEGANLFTVTAADVREALAPLCFVSAASIDRDFPETLAVTIDEHEPLAYALAGDRWHVVDRRGFVICRAATAARQLARTSAAGRDAAADATVGGSGAASTSDEDPAAAGAAAATGGDHGTLTARLVAGPAQAPLRLPRIAVSGRVREGARIDDDAAVDVLAVIAALPRSLQRRLAAARDDDGRITLRFDGGPVTVWGGAERTLAKTVAVRTVLKAYETAGEACTFLDVSIPDRTLARPVLP